AGDRGGPARSDRGVSRRAAPRRRRPVAPDAARGDDLPPGEGAIMLKLVFCLRRLPHLSRAEFQRYWHETHGPLVRSHAAVLGIRRYVQVHTLEDPVQDTLRASRGGPAAYDGVAELWGAGRDAVAAAPAGAAAPGAAPALPQ